jgi:hypothetical protein
MLHPGENLFTKYELPFSEVTKTADTISCETYSCKSSIKINYLTFCSCQTPTENQTTHFADFLHPHLWKMEYKRDWNTTTFLAVLEPGVRFFRSLRFNSNILLRILNSTVQQSCKINRDFVFYTMVTKGVILF